MGADHRLILCRCLVPASTVTWVAAKRNVARNIFDSLISGALSEASGLRAYAGWHGREGLMQGRYRPLGRDSRMGPMLAMFATCLLLAAAGSAAVALGQV